MDLDVYHQLGLTPFTDHTAAHKFVGMCEGCNYDIAVNVNL